VKVGQAGNPFAEFPQKKVREKDKAQSSKGVSAKKEPGFAEALSSAVAGNFNSALDDLMAGIVEQGERLARSQNFKELSRYKDLVRAFMAKISRELTRLKSTAAGSTKPGQKVFVILERVDAELENLSKLLLKGQAPQLKILEKLDQIRGLLLDAYL
jgi:uncharacterized protein YaaR (DUF327 family)